MLRGPGAAPAGRGPLARRLLAGALDRAVDAAASLELRGYGLDRPLVRRRVRSRHDRRLYLAGALVIAAAIAGKLAGADGFSAYPTLEASGGAPTVAVAVLVALSGLAPLAASERRPVGPAREVARA